MVDDMRRRGITTCTAEPLIARKAFDNTARIMNATVSRIVSQLFPQNDMQTLTRMHEQEALSLPRHSLGSSGARW
jgi:hypothetical protein